MSAGFSHKGKQDGEWMRVEESLPRCGSCVLLSHALLVQNSTLPVWAHMGLYSSVALICKQAASPSVIRRTLSSVGRLWSSHTDSRINCYSKLMAYWTAAALFWVCVCACVCVLSHQTLQSFKCGHCFVIAITTALPLVVVLNFVSGTEPLKFHTWIHRNPSKLEKETCCRI